MMPGPGMFNVTTHCTAQADFFESSSIDGGRAYSYMHFICHFAPVESAVHGTLLYVRSPHAKPHGDHNHDQTGLVQANSSYSPFPESHIQPYSLLI